VTKKTEDRKSRLARIRQRLSQANLGGGSFWKAKPGDNPIRILEGVGEMGLFWINVGLHYLSRCLLYTSPSPRDRTRSRMPSSA